MVEAWQADDERFAILAFSCTEGGGQVATALQAAYSGGRIRPGQDCLVRVHDSPGGVPLSEAALRRLANVMHAHAQPHAAGGRYVFLPESDRAAVVADIYIAICEAIGMPSNRMALARRPEEAAAFLGVASLEVDRVH